MEYVHTALLLHSAGKDISEENVENVLDAAGIDADSSRIKSLVAALEGVDIEEAMNKAVATGSAPAQPAQDEGASEEEEPEEDEAEEEDEGEAEAGLGELF